MKSGRKKKPAGTKAVDLHITLPVEEVRYLDDLADETGATRASVVREAVTAYRVQMKKAAIQAAMRKDVEKLAPWSDEFVREAEEHVTEVLLRETEW